MRRCSGFMLALAFFRGAGAPDYGLYWCAEGEIKSYVIDVDVEWIFDGSAHRNFRWLEPLCCGEADDAEQCCDLSLFTIIIRYDTAYVNEQHCHHTTTWSPFAQPHIQFSNTNILYYLQEGRWRTDRDQVYVILSLFLVRSFSCPVRWLDVHRLLEFSPVYFNHRTFPNGDTKIALQQMEARMFPQVQQNDSHKSSKRRRIPGIDVCKVDWAILRRRGWISSP